jgi:hypothetical protein
MRPISAPVASTRTASVFLYRGLSYHSVSGFPGFAPPENYDGDDEEAFYEQSYYYESGWDLTAFVSQGSFTENGATLRLAFNRELFDCETQPRPGDLIKIVVDQIVRSVTTVDAISDFTEARGTRSMTVRSRSRDGFEGWRTARASSPVFPMGASYLQIMNTICDILMALPAQERNFLPVQATVPHSNIQFADMTPWDMLEEVAFATNMEPFVDVLGVLRTFRIDTMRVADLAVPNDAVVEFIPAKQLNNSTTGSIRLAWLDPYLSKQYQPDQPLGTEIMTAGFFKLRVEKEVWFSSDRTQRAENTYMKVLDSVNDGILGISVASETYRQADPFHGKITLRTHWWVPTLYTVSLIALLAYDKIPDGVVGTQTVPIGRIVHGTALVIVMGIMMSMGTGSYEVRGTPYDFIHAKNHSVARACNLPFHNLAQMEVTSNLMMSEAHAQDTLVQRLMYLQAANYEMTVVIRDDPRIEKGDILLFEDGSRLMVSGFSCDVSRGAPAELAVSGILL